MSEPLSRVDHVEDRLKKKGMCMTNFGVRVPAIRGRQGSRTFYVLNLPNEFLRNIFKDVQPAVEKSQRPLDHKHSDDIKHYILNNRKEYLVGALTYAMDKDGEFIPMSGQGSEPFSLGVLVIPLGAQFSSLDGQHRREALVNLAADDLEIREETTAVLIYVESDLGKKRQMFSDMNSTPRKVSKSLNVAFDNRDPFARSAKIIITKHPLLVGRVEEMAPRVRPDSEYFFSLASVQDTLKKLFVGSAGRLKDLHRYTDAVVVQRGIDFFDILKSARPEYSEAMKDVAKLLEFRKQTILFSSTTLRALAGATFKASAYYDVERLTKIQDKLIDSISSIDFSIKSKLFIDSGFIQRGKSTPSARNQEVVSATNAIFETMKDGSGIQEIKLGSKKIKFRELKGNR